MMKRNNYIRKFLAWTLCLLMLVSMTAIPVLAAPDEEPAAPAAEVKEAPAEKAEAPVKEETPAKEEAPVKEEAPTKEETPAKEETPVKEESPAKEETSAKEEAPTKEETPAEVVDDSVEEPVDVPEAAEEPVADEPEEEPVEEPAPAAQPQSAPVATLFSVGGGNDDPYNGFSFDWSQEDVQDSGWDSKHGVVKTSRGYYLYFETGAWGSATVNVFTADNPWTPAMGFSSNAWDVEHLQNSMNGNAVWEDAEVNYYISGGRRYTEAFVPTDLLPEGDLTFSCNEASFAFAAPATQASADEEEGAEAVYTGIVIDGDFSDWAAVPRYDVVDLDLNGNPKGYDTVDHMAVVWDGDWVYILLVADGDRDWEGNLTGMGNWDSVCGGGTHGHGQYAITSDLGRTLLVQPVSANKIPTVAGVDGAKAAVNTKAWEGAPFLWELAIPASELPQHLETINFGFYMAEPTITGISNMQGNNDGVDPFAANVVIDGKFNDWIGYPHALIQYDHQGIQHHQVDGEGALWCDGTTLYGHVDTEHPDHLAEQGSCYLAAISIAFNGDRSYKDLPEKGNFYPRILAIDEDGTITDYYKTVNEGHSTPNGTYTYYIFDTRTDPVQQFGHEDENGVWHDATAADLRANAFGIMKVTVTGVKDEVEFELDLERVADYIHQDADSAFKTIDIQWGRIGQQWITIAGTPTGPVFGVALAVGAVGAPVCYSELRRRRSKKKAESESQDK